MPIKIPPVVRRTKRGHRLNWIPDPNPVRESPHHYAIPPAHIVESLPASVDLRPFFASHNISVYDQGSEGSCTAHAWAGCAQYLRAVAKKPNNWVPSRQFIYWCERFIENDTGTDAGAMVGSGQTALAKWGVCPESTWPYVASDMLTQPSQVAYAQAKPHVLKGGQPIDNRNLKALKSALALRLPIVNGFLVYSSFESDAVAQTGIIPMPDAATEQLLGGHSTLTVGYDDAKQWFICRNSWSPGWGAQGYFYMPYNYLTNEAYAQDFHLGHSFS